MNSKNPAEEKMKIKQNLKSKKFEIKKSALKIEEAIKKIKK
ncbi:hypothetical protein [Marinibactrum halimedae]|uniref:Uncharacterized protein n=1 Tax=Marinibactrum halimedae TaxID=1444977 RepID=A0AA37TDP3_9GAMM|nr:hypothetical protein [Marinibactrum halimedae]GLS27955.1 hypothetical protein GCM10007877_36740 [Marinibactrum halimedae]